MDQNIQSKFEHHSKKIAADVLRPINLSTSFKAWMGFLILALAICVYVYIIQLQKGLGVTGMGDFVSWGMYIANFVFFVACSLIGMLISAVLGLIGYKWITPLTRISEIIAIGFAAVAGLVIVSDMGRPDRLPYVFMYARFQSPILWDVSVVTTYFVVSLLLWFLPLIPDLGISKHHIKHPPVLQKIYKILSLKWTNSPQQNKIIQRSMRLLLILIVPLAFAIHTVTSWLFAVNPRVGWDSTIFGPYFISGAFVAGIGCVVIAMYFFRNNYRLQEYIQELHFDRMGKLLFLVSIVYLYFNLNEFLVPAYKLKQADAIHLHEIFSGRFAAMFWLTQILGLVIPMILMLIPRMRKPLPMMVISIFVVLGAWFKRYIIVIPPQEHHYLPVKQYVNEKFVYYTPTIEETAIALGSVILVLIIITLLSKFFPVIPIWETAKERAEEKDTTYTQKNNELP